MSLIKSIAGIRGTIGGAPGEALTPFDIVSFTAAYSTLIRESSKKETKLTVVVGKDARISGEMVENLVVSTLSSCGVDVINISFATTPTVEMAVVSENADGGIIITASHNPREWNALKLLNNRGEFLSAQDGSKLIDYISEKRYFFASVDNLGKITSKDLTKNHIESVLKYPLLNTSKIYSCGFKVVIDPVNSVGAISLPYLLEQLGVNYECINCIANGEFNHNPEPLPHNLTGLSEAVIKSKADLGIAVDPDVDRLVLICEDGTPFGEEYTLVAVADYVLSKKRGNSVSNLSSTRALKDITEKHGGEYYSAAVGEVNVVEMMKKVEAVIGGEGNGGVIVPDLHYGRDAIIGIALFLSHLSERGCKASELRDSYPQYFISKNKISTPDNINFESVVKKVIEFYPNSEYDTRDGLRVDFKDRSWVQIRKSNTEPIIRIFSESPEKESADKLANNLLKFLETII